MRILVSIAATIVVALGGYLFLRSPAKKKTDRITVRVFLLDTVNSVKLYFSRLFKTNEVVTD